MFENKPGEAAFLKNYYALIVKQRSVRGLNSKTILTSDFVLKNKYLEWFKDENTGLTCKIDIGIKIEDLPG